MNGYILKKQTLFQVACIFIFNFIVLELFRLAGVGDLVWAVGCGSLAASSCIVFAKPSALAAHPVRLFATYLIAILWGASLHYVAVFFNFPIVWMNVLAVIAVCCAFISMLFLKLEHPPALGLALVLVLEMQNVKAITAILISIIILLIFRFVCVRFLRDLY